jgi:hypothetical protein
MVYVKVHDYQDEICFTVYVFTDSTPTYVTDPGCTELGEVDVQVSNAGEGKKTVKVDMVFSGTELEVRVRDENDKITKGRFNFLGDM